MEIQSGIIIAVGKTEVGEKIRDILVEGGYNVLAVCKSGNDLIRKTLQYDPILVVLSYRLPDITAIDVYNFLDGKCEFLVLANETYLDIADESVDLYYLPKPLTKSGLLNSVSMILQSRRKIIKLKEKVDKLQTKMEERKIIDKAKGILMSNMGISEMESFRLIQQRSMNLGERMVIIAQGIIENFRNN